MLLALFCRSAKRSLNRGPNPLLAALLEKEKFCFVLRFSSDKDTAKSKKMRIPAVLECQPVQGSPQYPCEVQDNHQTV
jgi:hypothetical protein